jgi:hypothetical protein
MGPGVTRRRAANSSSPGFTVLLWRKCRFRHPSDQVKIKIPSGHLSASVVADCDLLHFLSIAIHKVILDPFVKTTKGPK